jgi:hypothetical protein
MISPLVHIDEEGDVVNGWDSGPLGRPDESQTVVPLSYVIVTPREENAKILLAQERILRGLTQCGLAQCLGHICLCEAPS